MDPLFSTWTLTLCSLFCGFIGGVAAMTALPLILGNGKPSLYLMKHLARSRLLSAPEEAYVTCAAAVDGASKVVFSTVLRRRGGRCGELGETLHSAMQTLQRRHPLLRSQIRRASVAGEDSRCCRRFRRESLLFEEGNPRFCNPINVLPFYVAEGTETDATSLEGSLPTPLAHALRLNMEREVNTPFGWEAHADGGPAAFSLRYCVFEQDDGVQWLALVLVLHHAICDGISGAALCGELVQQLLLVDSSRMDAKRAATTPLFHMSRSSGLLREALGSEVVPISTPRPPLDLSVVEKTGSCNLLPPSMYARIELLIPSYFIRLFLGLCSLFAELTMPAYVSIVPPVIDGRLAGACTNTNCGCNHGSPESCITDGTVLPLTRICCRQLDVDETRRLRARCRAHGVTLNSALNACVASAVLSFVRRRVNSAFSCLDVLIPARAPQVIAIRNSISLRKIFRVPPSELVYCVGNTCTVIPCGHLSSSSALFLWEVGRQINSSIGAAVSVQPEGAVVAAATGTTNTMATTTVTPAWLQIAANTLPHTQQQSPQPLAGGVLHTLGYSLFQNVISGVLLARSMKNISRVTPTPVASFTVSNIGDQSSAFLGRVSDEQQQSFAHDAPERSMHTYDELWSSDVAHDAHERITTVDSPSYGVWAVHSFSFCSSVNRWRTPEVTASTAGGRLSLVFSLPWTALHRRAYCTDALPDDHIAAVELDALAEGVWTRLTELVRDSSD